MSVSSPADRNAALVTRRKEFKAFLTALLGNEADAEDVLQDSLLRALRKSADVGASEKLIPWFYRVLRNAVADHQRSRGAARKRELRWHAEAESTFEPAHERQLCRCFERLLPTLPARQAALLQRVEIEQVPLATAASELGITPNHASVTLHRARSALRAKLAAVCGASCACLDDCTCS